MMARSRYAIPNPQRTGFPKSRSLKKFGFAAILVNGVAAKGTAAAARTAARTDAACSRLRNNPDKLIHKLNIQITLHTYYTGLVGTIR